MTRHPRFARQETPYPQHEIFERPLARLVAAAVVGLSYVLYLVRDLVDRGLRAADRTIYLALPLQTLVTGEVTGGFFSSALRLVEIAHEPSLRLRSRRSFPYPQTPNVTSFGWPSTGRPLLDRRP